MRAGSEKRRMPAEWEEVHMIQLTCPNEDTDWSYMFEEVVECYRSILSALLRETSVDVLIVARSKEET